ncbi:hypothetical protein KR093_003440 [Drosophila rubida]|uniref:Chitin-binding type-2 domain-containing protein n=1 Tax=Drosophila rubida TaxID=30044 RepID=A0AAD4JSQ9_9MUSC|nr:hypothetical protein KR093_003440 [Drosophila rubida]
MNGSIEELNCTGGSYFNSSLKTCLIDNNGICSSIHENCTQGEIEQNPADPCGYLQCVNGSLEDVNCTSGSYFNSTLKTCLIDNNGICSSNHENCTEGEIEQNPADPCGYLQCVNGSLEDVNCTSGSYFNSTLKTCLIDNNGICSSNHENCTEGEIEQNPADPCGYLQCVNGSLEDVNCTSGSYFNSTLKTCLIDNNGICSSNHENCTEGEIEQNPADPCGYLQCVNGSLEEVNCTSGSYFNSTLKTCLIDNNGICSSNYENCTEGGIEQNPADPCGYLQCVNGSLENVNCTSGSYFNSTLNICLIDKNGICSSNHENCTEGEIEQNPADPCGYLRCINGNLEELNCTSGSYFNNSLKACLVDENGVCRSIMEDCIDGDIVENSGDPCGYLICKYGAFSEVNCSSGSYYNSTLKTCLLDKNGICASNNFFEECIDGEVEENPENCCGYLVCKYGSYSEVNCNHGDYFNSSLKTCLLAESGVCSEISEECIEDETQPDPEECAGYLQCINGELVSQFCAYGSYFDATLKSCMVDNDGVCISTSEICEEGERKEEPDDWTSYLECINGDFVERSCPEGSYFESSIKGCTIDENGVYGSQLDLN